MQQMGNPAFPSDVLFSCCVPGKGRDIETGKNRALQDPMYCRWDCRMVRGTCLWLQESRGKWDKRGEWEWVPNRHETMVLCWVTSGQRRSRRPTTHICWVDGHARLGSVSLAIQGKICQSWGAVWGANSSRSKSLLYVTFQHKWSFKWHYNTIKTLYSIDEMNNAQMMMWGWGW